MTPSVAILRISSPYWRGLRLWVPLFLLWIPLLLLGPLLLVGLAVACLLGRIPYFGALRCAWSLLSGLRGVEVDVRTPSHFVQVRVA